uniref:Uncharacterized protein n=1 Tax=Rhizophagus irregularis (strain DAOM 181602 / DAOM 197198 / MUCL 43194) TaxID=747089 RepID=U9U2X0_RHIID
MVIAFKLMMEENPLPFQILKRMMGEHPLLIFKRMMEGHLLVHLSPIITQKSPILNDPQLMIMVMVIKVIKLMMKENPLPFQIFKRMMGEHPLILKHMVAILLPYRLTSALKSAVFSAAENAFVACIVIMSYVHPIMWRTSMTPVYGKSLKESSELINLIKKYSAKNFK